MPGKIERRTIKVISVGNWRDVGKAKVLEFAGADRVNYETWNESLAEFIKVDALIEADVEFTERVHEGKTYFHNKVFQIYINGQPVKSKARGFIPQDSPEKTASIENQKRADLINQAWIAGKYPDNHPLVLKMQAWLGQIDAVSITSTQTIKLKVDAEQVLLNKTGDFANVGEFLTACSKNLGLNKSQVMKGLGANSLDNVNFNDAYYFLLEEAKAKPSEELPF